MEIINGDGCLVTYTEDWLPEYLAKETFDALFDITQWQSRYIELYGAKVPLPRLTAWHGDENVDYTYSGIKYKPEPWNDVLTALRKRLEISEGIVFNSVLLNFYRNGRDSVGWHADDEPELGLCPIIASVSLGATRRFDLKDRFSGDLRTIDLVGGSLLVMSGKTQYRWRHQIPKTKEEVGPRINLTFRNIIGASRDK